MDSKLWNDNIVRSKAEEWEALMVGHANMPAAVIVTVDIELKNCPFCDGNNLELTNTWTPSFWVECLECGAQVGGESIEGEHDGERPCHFSSLDDGGSDGPLNEFQENYQRAAASAIAVWNRRA